MLKTKIICTIGPASEDQNIQKNLAEKGMRVARLNFSHGTHEEHAKRINAIREIAKQKQIPLGIMLDTKGPEIRTGLCDKPIKLTQGSTIKITGIARKSTENNISIGLKNLENLVSKKTRIYMADGTIAIEVIQIQGNEILCKVINGGIVESRKNVTIPGIKLKMPSISSQDKKDIQFGAEHDVDIIAQSFVSNAQDVKQMKHLLSTLGSDAIVTAKIENAEAVKNIDAIIEQADAVMIARGDLGVHMPIEQIPGLQKMITRKCAKAGKPVIVATQMLESMTNCNRPTRAEVTDVANAIMDGADALMLSGETAAGKYPLDSVEIMAKVIQETEKELKPRYFDANAKDKHIALSSSVCRLAEEVKAKAIISCTLTGHTARMISRHKPTMPILAPTPNSRELSKLCLWYGVEPFKINMLKETDDLIHESVNTAKKKNHLSQGDTAILTIGVPFSKPGLFNMLKIHEVE